MPNSTTITLSDEVRAAINAGRPVVALESTLLAHGLSYPANIELAWEVDAIVRDASAVPATVAVIRGLPTIGLDDEAMAILTQTPGISKLSARDLAIAMGTGIDGATTVASTAALAAAVGISVFATGGLGGVHRDARESFDESADLATLARTPIVVVCAGVKSLLDISATLERLESLNVAVAGYRTNRFPGFYRRDSGYPVDWSLDNVASVARVAHARTALRRSGVAGADGALVLANPLPEGSELDASVHDEALANGLAEAARLGIRGKAVTPFLLGHFHAATGGESLRVNLEIIRRNARLAAEIAVAIAEEGR